MIKNALFDLAQVPRLILSDTEPILPLPDLLSGSGRCEEISPAERLTRIDRLDLSKMKIRVKKDHSWTDEQVNHSEKWYRRFLKLIVLCPGEPLVPNKSIDEMWHAHILDTRKYRQDCLYIFGEMIDHQPSYEEGDIGDITFADTNRLFHQEFGEMAVWEGEVAPGFCVVSAKCDKRDCYNACGDKNCRGNHASAEAKCNKGSDDPSCYNSDGDRT